MERPRSFGASLSHRAARLAAVLSSASLSHLAAVLNNGVASVSQPSLATAAIADCIVFFSVSPKSLANCCGRSAGGPISTAQDSERGDTWIS